MTRMFSWIKRRKAAVAFVILALAIGLAIQREADHAARSSAVTVWHSQLHSCARGNKFRTDINQRLRASNTVRVQLIGFLEDASAARWANFGSTHLAADRKAAQEYAARAARVRSKVVYVPFPQISCSKVYPKP